MKTCVFIIGTNAVGKTSVVRTLIEKFGGIERTTKLATFCKDGRHSFGGEYREQQSQTGCGIDKFNETKVLESVVRAAFDSSDTVFCEGVYLHTFGLNLTNAMFLGERHLVVFLYCPVKEIHRRLLARAGRGITNEAIWKKQLCCATSAKKWASIGVPVLSFDTSKQGTAEVAESIIAKLDEICTE